MGVSGVDLPEKLNIFILQGRIAQLFALERRTLGLGQLWASLGDLPEKLVDTLAVWPLAAMFLRWLLALPPVRRALGASAAASREHARRLSSVAANAKFSSLDADADTPWTVRRNKFTTSRV